MHLFERATMSRVALRILLLLFLLFVLTPQLVYAVSISSFAATWRGNQVVVTWTTTNDLDFAQIRLHMIHSLPV